MHSDKKLRREPIGDYVITYVTMDIERSITLCGVSRKYALNYARDLRDIGFQNVRLWRNKI